MQKLVSLLATHALALSAFGVLLFILIVGSLVKQSAYSKIQPYQVHLDVSASRAGTLKLSYDYGYGPLPEHSRVIAIEAGQNQVRASISAWKAMRSLSLSAIDPGDYMIERLSIFKASDSPLASKQDVALSTESSSASMTISLAEL